MASNWTKQAIIFALREKGITAAGLARQNDLSRFTIYSGMERPAPKVQSLISEALGVPRQQIWPQFYDKQGNRIGLIGASRAA
ncbi:MAG: helix-turn-helix domain-containing protein [Bosea sp.]|uniref:helix-turn-helix domain-containing protein n=1 Tax=Bosea sp. (in: a-proteobacteria) TaxID=1871050 RepID=UPI001AD4F28B|nr:helix-turn-helix domain-containing protein [Bosea sp. (in: a-proteobacteria)]MBN9471707.1 helix-turn-helix domain-containing protein [Bosea sp. (in: a-proteobacteria)]